MTTLRAAASIDSSGTPGRAAVERGRLRPLDDVEHRLIFVGGLAEHERSGDVRLVSLDRAAVVDHDDRAFANRLRRDRAVGQRRVLTDLHAGPARETRPGDSRRR